VKGEKLNKTAFFSLISTISIPLASAQDTIGGGTTLEESLVQFANDLLIYEISSASGFVLYFIAPVAGFYFIQKNMLSFGFELFEERIDRHSYGRRDDDIPNGIKGLSIVTAFITTQMLGAFSAGILLATGLISILLAVIMQLGLLDGIELGGGGGNTPRTTNNGNNNAAQNTQNTNGNNGTSTNWNQLAQDVGGIASEINKMNSSGSSSGNNRGPERSMDNALDMMKRIQDKSGKGKILDTIEKDAVVLNDAIVEAENAINDGKIEINSVHDLKKRVDQLLADLHKFKNIAEASGSSERDIAKLEQELKNNNRPIGQQVQKIRKDLEKIKDAEKNELSHLEDEIDELVYAAELYAMILGFVGRLPKPLDKFTSDDRMMKSFIKRGVKRGILDKPPGAGKVVNFGTPYQNYARELKKSLNKLDGELGDINANIKRAEKLLEQELKIDKSEISQMKTAIEKVNKSGELVDQIEQEINSSGSIDSSSDISKNLISDLNYVKSELSSIKSELQQLETRMGSDTEYESKMSQKLRDIYQK